MARGQSLDWWKFYTGDFFADTEVELMDGPTRAAYLLLLARCWHLRAVLRDPVAELVKQGYTAAEAGHLWGEMRELWDEVAGGWTHHRVASDYPAQKRLRAARIEAGRKGADSKWHGKRGGKADGKTDGHSALSTQHSDTRQEPPLTPPPEGKAGGPRKGKLHRWQAVKLAKYPQLVSGALAEELAPWEDHLEQRLGRAYTDAGADRLLGAIAAMTPPQLRAAVQNSLEGNYQKLVEPPHGRSFGASANPAMDRVREIFGRAATQDQDQEPRTVEAEEPK